MHLRPTFQVCYPAVHRRWCQVRHQQQVPHRREPVCRASHPAFYLHELSYQVRHSQVIYLRPTFQVRHPAVHQRRFQARHRQRVPHPVRLQARHRAFHRRGLACQVRPRARLRASLPRSHRRISRRTSQPKSRPSDPLNLRLRNLFSQQRSRQKSQ